MKPGLYYFLWALPGIAVLGVVMFLALYLQPSQTASEYLAVEARKIELAGRIRLALATAAEAEKSAVLANTDEASIAFAQQALAATATAEEQRNALAGLLQTGGTAKEKELLDQFSKAFSEFQHVDKELLDLAVKNTNLKASALAFGPGAEAIGRMDVALSRIIAASAHAADANAKQEMLLAARAQAAALRIQVLLPPHIAEENDQKMDELEARMAKEDQDVQRGLKGLKALVRRNADLEAATSSYARFMELKTQILKLSRENTNVRSLAISLNQKRKVTVLCQDDLAALEKAIEDARTAGVDHAPVRPR
jgi:Four helix bundle sensory module for signal transduction